MSELFGINKADYLAWRSKSNLLYLLRKLGLRSKPEFKDMTALLNNMTMNALYQREMLNSVLDKPKV